MSEDFKLTWLPKKTFEIVAKIPWYEIEKTRGEVLKKEGEEIEIKGFRKGKAPQKLVIEAIGTKKLLELTISELIPAIYQKAVESLGLKPILSPKIELLSNKENEDWEIKFTSCEEPEINLGSYKEDLKKELSAGKIWTPGKNPDKDSQSGEKDREEKLQKAISFLLKNISVQLSELLIEQEVNHKLAGLLQQTQKLGLTIDQYLASTGKTVETIKEEYQKQAESNLALEFILRAIQEKENIQVEPEEVDKAISEAKTEEDKKALENQKYFLASLLRQQKTLDFLAKLV